MTESLPATAVVRVSRGSFDPGRFAEVDAVFRDPARFSAAIAQDPVTPFAPEAREILAAKTPLGVPWIEPEDVAPVVVFLASEAGRMASGSTFEITAGDSAHNTA